MVSSVLISMRSGRVVDCFSERGAARIERGCRHRRAVVDHGRRRCQGAVPRALSSSAGRPVRHWSGPTLLPQERLRSLSRARRRHCFCVASARFAITLRREGTTIRPGWAARREHDMCRGIDCGKPGNHRVHARRRALLVGRHKFANDVNGDGCTATDSPRLNRQTRTRACTRATELASCREASDVQTCSILTFAPFCRAKVSQAPGA